jgi:4-hydroxy-4-methyl-2-oxoglutarate aldolase
MNDLEILKAAGTAVIADVFDSLGMLPPVLDNQLTNVSSPVVYAGPAYTITGETQTFTGGDRAKLEAIDRMTAGIVAVWASNDAKGVCCFGDLLASAMKARGCAAAVVDGGVRDTSFLSTLGMPVISRYRTPAQGIGRWKVSASQIPVRVHGALTEWLTVTPGDTIVGDSDGVIIVPKALLQDVLAKVALWAESDTSAREEILKGLPLLNALAKYGHL